MKKRDSGDSAFVLYRRKNIETLTEEKRHLHQLLTRTSYTRIESDYLTLVVTLHQIVPSFQPKRVPSSPTSGIPLPTTLISRWSGLSTALSRHAERIACSRYSRSANSNRVFDVVAIACDALAPIPGLICDPAKILFQLRTIMDEGNAHTSHQFLLQSYSPHLQCYSRIHRHNRQPVEPDPAPSD